MFVQELQGMLRLLKLYLIANKISYSKLLEVFWFVHDPTQLNRQGNDVGTHYRSVIFYHSLEQKNQAEFFKAELEKKKIWNKPIVTEISALGNFFGAEEYHRDYLYNNPGNPYCQMVVRPKYEKFREAFLVNLK